ncbi:hypothetical protein ACVJH7_009359 [Bradyrhizobium elkanii]
MDEAAGAHQFENERSLCRHYPTHDPLIGSHEVMHFVPSRQTRSGQIEASGIVLLYSGCLRKKGMKLAIMAENYPAFPRNFANPFIIRSLVAESEFVFRIVVVLNRKMGWSGRPDCLRQPFPDIPIKVQCQ